MKSTLFSMITLVGLFLCPALSYAQFFGVVVHHYKGNVIRPQYGTFLPKEHRLTVLAVYPQPTPTFIGIDLGLLKDFLTTHQWQGVDQVSHYFMDIIQNSYFKIAGERGVLKVGGTFQQDLATKEPFWDGRSAAIALFEGDDFSKPLATFRVAYSTPQHPTLPFEKRIQINLSDLRSDAPIEELPLNKIVSTLGLNFNDRNIVEKLINHASSAGGEGQFFAQILKMASPGISKGHKFLIPMDVKEGDQEIKAGSLVPFEKVLELAVQQLKHPLLVGGRGAELKGLSHARNDQRTDYMHFLFEQAIQRGFFDLIPYVNGYAIPITFSGETSVGHVKNQYKNWNWNVLKVIDDPTYEGETAVVQFKREDLGNLPPQFFNRATAGGLFDLKDPSYQDFLDLLGKSEAQTLAFDNGAPLYKVSASEIILHNCNRDLSHPQ